MGGAHRRGSESPRALRRLGDHLPLGPRRRRRRPRLEPEMELAGGGRQRAADRQGPRRRRPAGRAQRRGAVERRTGPLRHGLRLCGRRARSRTLPRAEPAPVAEGRQTTLHDEVFVETLPSGPGMRGWCVVGPRYKYVPYQWGRNREALYDLQDDSGRWSTWPSIAVTKPS